MNIEQITREYLSSFFGQDLNECVDSLTEEHITEAIASINLLAKALNEQWQSNKPLPEVSGNTIQPSVSKNTVDYGFKKQASKPIPFTLVRGRDAPPEMAARDAADLKVFNQFDNLLGGKKVIETPRLDFGERSGRGLYELERQLGIPNENKFSYKKIQGLEGPQLQTLASFEDIEKRVKEYDLLTTKRLETAKSNLATTKATSQRNQAQRDAPKQETSFVGDPERYNFYKSRDVKPTGKSTGAEGDLPSYTLDDKLKYWARMQEQVFYKLFEQYNPGYPETGNIDYNSPEIQAARESGRRIAEKEGRVGPGMYKVPGSEKKFNVGKRLDPNNPADAALIKQGEDAWKRVLEKEKKNDPDGSKRRARIEAADRRMRARAEYEGSEEGQAAANRAIEAENQSRATRGLPPLNATAARRLGRRVIASDVARGVADASRRAAANNQPPQSEEDYMSSVFPGGVAPEPPELLARPQTQMGPPAPTQDDRDGIPYFLQRPEDRGDVLSPGRPVNPANPYGPRVSRPGDKPGFRTTGSTPPVM